MKKEKNKAFDIINHESAYWLGIMFSDGCICKTTGGRHILKLTSMDKDTIEKFSIFLKTDNKKQITISKINKNIYYSISISNEYIFNRLNELGCVIRKTKILMKPKIANKYIFSFLCGYFDGDGSISLNKNINSWKVSMGFASENFYLWIKSILDSKNIIYSIEEKTTKTNTPFFVVCMNGISAKYFLGLCYENLNKKIFMKRKFEKYDEMRRENFANPKITAWEMDIINKNSPEIAKIKIETDKRNYGWKRNIRTIRDKKKNLGIDKIV